MFRTAERLGLLVGVAVGLSASPAGAVIGGTQVAPGQFDYIVKIKQCTGIMIAPNVVITARHCIAQIDDGSIRCDPTFPFKPAAGFAETKEQAPIFLAPFASGAAPSAYTVKSFSPGTLDVCWQDITAAILDRDLDVPIAPIRLFPDVALEAGEAITLVGAGTMNEYGDSPVDVRFREQTTLLVGPGYYTWDPWYPEGIPQGVLFTGEGFCSGDSGGAVIRKSTGAVVALHRAQRQLDPAKLKLDLEKPYLKCVGDVLTEETILSYHSELILNALKEAGHAPYLEGHGPPGDFGSPCSLAAECNSWLCSTPSGGAGQCTRKCDTEPCPSGYDCLDSAGAKVCVSTAASSEPQPDGGPQSGDGGGPETPDGGGDDSGQIPTPTAVPTGKPTGGGGCTILGAPSGGLGFASAVSLIILALSRRRRR